MEAIIVLFLLFCVCAAPSVAAQNRNSIIPVLSELRPGTNSSVWLSESRIFAFGFYDTPDGYALCIFMFDGFFTGTVVWTPNNLDPILPANIFSLKINGDRIQLFQNREGSKAIYYDIATTDEAIAGASMLDNGNFVVYGHNGGVIWQSFDSPTDTLLPGQRLPSGQELVSRASQMDLGRGKFRLKMQADGNLVQYPVSSLSDTAENAYYSSGTYGDGKNLSLNLENDGRLHVYNGAVSYNITTGWKPKVGSMYMVRVDMDGIFRIYNRVLDPVVNWTVIWSSTEDRCVPKGICGANSFCTYQDQVVTCTCLPGFGDGCKENFDIGVCRNKDPSVRYEMRKMANVTWEDNHYAVEDTEGEEDCGDACVSDCDCVLALFKDGKCRKQRLPIMYGIRSASVSNMALVRVSVPVPTPPLVAPNASGKK